MLISEIVMLMEDRSEYVAQQMGKQLEAAAQSQEGRPMKAKEIVDAIRAMDPDPMGRNLTFLARMYIKQQFRLEDQQKIRDAVTSFYKFRNRLPVKDMNQVQSLDQLYDMVEPLEQEEQAKIAAGGPGEQSKRQADIARRREVMKDVVEVMRTPNLAVFIPKTEQASCELGKGTKWCTAGENNNMFQSYSKQGPLYVIRANIGGKERKFQLHYESDQFMNERDSAVSASEIAELSKIPEYKDFLNMLIKKYYGKYLTDPKSVQELKAIPDIP